MSVCPPGPEPPVPRSLSPEEGLFAPLFIPWVGLFAS